MQKKSLLIFALTALMSVTACNNGAYTEVDQTLPEDDPSSEVVINFWHCLGQAKEKEMTKIVTAFNQKWSGKYKVVLTKPAGGYDDLHDTIKTKLASGEVPALAMGYPDSFSEYITSRISESYILRLNNFIKDPKFGYSEDEINDFVPVFYNEGTNYQFEGVWSMPMYKSTEVMYYNAAYFAGSNPMNDLLFAENSKYQELKAYVQGGMADVDDKNLEALKTWVKANNGCAYDVPETWDEAIATARKMKADREMIPGEFYPFGYDSDANLMISQMAQRGIEYTANDDASKDSAREHFKFNNDQAKALASEIVGYLNEKIMITKNSLGGQKYTNDYFTEGKCAFTVGSTGGSDYQVSENFAVKLAPAPYKGQRKYIQQGPSICFFDCGNEYIHKGAWLFYKEFADPIKNVSVALENSYDPVRVSSYTSEEYERWLSNAGLALKYDIPNITRTLKDYYITSPVFIGSSTARKEIGNVISYMYASKMSVDKAFETALDNCVNAVK